MIRTNQTTPLSQDRCSVFSRDLQNQSGSDYRITNFFLPSTQGECQQHHHKIQETVVSNRAIHIRDGIGNVNPCFVNEDTCLTRNRGTLTHDRKNQQLGTRWTLGANMDKGGLVPDVYSRLINGEPTHEKGYTVEECALPIAESQYANSRITVDMPWTGCVQAFIKDAQRSQGNFVFGSDYGVPTRGISYGDDHC